MDLVLYRKYRPQKFNQFIGQENILKTITSAILKNLISHAYLFAGPRGTGKTTLARLLAKSLNCEKRKKDEYEPCLGCLNCREIEKGIFLDLVEIDAGSHRGIDEIRELKEKIGFLPVKGKYKVFIIDEAHQLSKDAGNALLKTLEEPPPHAIFILATTEPSKMIPTILSRCQRFDFQKLTLFDIVKKLEFILKKEKVSYEKSAIRLIAENADGSMRDGETLLDQIIASLDEKEKITRSKIISLLGLVEPKLIIELADFIKEKDTFKALKLIEKEVEKGLNLSLFIKSFNSYLKDLLLLKMSSNPESSYFLSKFSQDQIKKMKEQIKSFTLKELSDMLEIFIEAENRLKFSSLPQIPIQLAFIKAIKRRK